jgi:hypothetical protein
MIPSPRPEAIALMADCKSLAFVDNNLRRGMAARCAKVFSTDTEWRGE